VDEDVQALVDEEDEESVALLEQSLFERLFDAAPDTHKAMLDTQYRMPASIANFISEFFYGGKYHTASSLQSDPADPFFSCPICFVDTGHRKRYWERKGQGEEGGYANPGEAEVLARLADAYLNRNYDLAVIVPYKLQVAQMQRALRRRRPDLDESDVRDIVATVDSFQGQQRNTILFGFTRSNNWGGVGFLYELRRLNVTITRVQRQLVLVGDSTALTQAGDLGFRGFANALLEYIRRKGQYLGVGQLEEVLRGRDR
jgi:superfamily I DNA and/or RNA helicase